LAVAVYGRGADRFGNHFLGICDPIDLGSTQAPLWSADHARRA